MARRKLGFWGRFAVSLVKPATALMNKPDWRGFEHLQRPGGVIVVVNHMSDADPFVIARYVYESGRWPQFLAKESLFRLPVAGKILEWCRQVPVRRGTIEAARALDDAVEALRNNGTVVIYPEGTITRDPDLWPMKGKTGAARLALLTGAPVIPVAMWGAEEIYDRRKPSKKLRLRPRTPVWVWAGPPVDLDQWLGEEASAAVLNDMTDAMMLRIRDILAEIRGVENPPPLWTPERKEAGE
ncbi:lysophospholipid acyltransferase family protein [Catelliglobosispora koreensis]|uniref:lysophospholipid acyltransferase family protein n=1 Tax=Catelliglobosispora koreensis TaxID=129052 RepID=UPI00037564FB|nr:lysophospholipid acyltransferase family protein [Catelliglobosispora koreensis]